MKKYLYAIFLLFTLASCYNVPSYGYLVHKECIKYHMSNERPKVTYEASFGVVVVPRVHHRPRPKFVPTRWVFYVGNKYGVRSFDVDSVTYHKYKCGTRLTF